MTYVILKYLSGHGQLYGCCPLIVPLGVAVRSVVPAVKALIATELLDQHGLKQDEVAEIPGFPGLPLVGTPVEQEDTQ
jgi:hypothetical protein